MNCYQFVKFLHVNFSCDSVKMTLLKFLSTLKHSKCVMTISWLLITGQLFTYSSGPQILIYICSILLPLIENEEGILDS